MFKLLLHITTIFGIALLFSCASDSMQENKSAASVTEEAEPSAGENNKYAVADFEIGTLPKNLSPDQQEAFQLRAKQKFQDFTDYLKIISNPKMDKDLKKHSQKLLKELFLNDSITFSDTTNSFYIPFNPNDSTPVMISDFHNINLLITFKRPLKISIQSISFTNLLATDSNNIYRGIMQAQLTVNKKNVSKNIDVYLIEIDKQFGETTQKTIEIKLGNIY
jgi:hypothetical protein